MNNYTAEKNKLLKHIANEEIIQLFKSAKCFIAGGAVTSVFSNKEINDIDVYFRDYESLRAVLKALFNIDDHEEKELYFEGQSFSMVYTNHTKKSISFIKDKMTVQLIYFRFFNSAEEIFNTFDFSVNMGCYDCASGDFILHPDFIKDIAQRSLRVNPHTAFPIISLLRVDKYKQKGYDISRKAFITLCLAVNNLQLKTWEQLADAIGGMYGYVYDDVFDTTKPFSIEEAINQLEKLESNLEKYNTRGEADYYCLIDSVNQNLGITPKPEACNFYKKVVKTDKDNIYRSVYMPSFKYEIGKTVNGGGNGVYAYKSFGQAKSHCCLEQNTEIIMLKPCARTKVVKDSGNIYRLVGDVEVVGKVEE